MAFRDVAEERAEFVARVTVALKTLAQVLSEKFEGRWTDFKAVETKGAGFPMWTVSARRLRDNSHKSAMIKFDNGKFFYLHGKEWQECDDLEGAEAKAIAKFVTDDTE